MARAKIFKHGGSQAVRLPKEFRFEVDEVDIHREGDAVILSAPQKPRPQTKEDWEAFWARIDALRGDEILVRPPQPMLRDVDFDE
ncbi:MAG TPA: AbrB/MazE/SpoVT family DNA-binding domain-containing protein [Caulobacteraceae bacterium]